jgi:hypothetical protein
MAVWPIPECMTRTFIRGLVRELRTAQSSGVTRWKCPDQAAFALAAAEDAGQEVLRCHRRAVVSGGNPGLLAPEL